MLCCDFLFPRRRVLLERCKNVKFCTNINNDKKIKRQETGIKGLLLLHDSAPAHKSKLVTDFLSVEGVIVIRRPAYPPDPPPHPRDFFLFPRLIMTISWERNIEKNFTSGFIKECK